MTSAVSILTYRRVDSLKLILSQAVEKLPAEIPIAVFEDCGQTDNTEALLIQNATFIRRDYGYEADVYEQIFHGRKVTVFLSHVNAGVAANSNKAIKWFMEETQAGHLCLCNDDLQILGDFTKTYREAHTRLGVGLFCYCGFTDASYAWTTIKVKGISVKMLTRMTGIMMSFTRDLIEKIGYFDAELYTFGQEHSLVAGTQILMADYTWRSIETITSGERVIGWQKRTSYAQKYAKLYEGKETKQLWQEMVKTNVIKTHSYISDVLELTLASGRKITCTPDHRWYRGIARGKASYQKPKIGLKMKRLFEPSPVTKESTDYLLGYVNGSVAGDGHFSKTKDSASYLRVTHGTFIKKFCKSLSCLGIEHHITDSFYDVKTTDGTVIGQAPITKVKANTFTPTYTDSDDYWAGWLGGIYDAEGCSTSIAQSIDVNPDVYANIVSALTRFGFKLNKKPHQIEWAGGRAELLRFWNLARPSLTYKMDAKFLQGMECSSDRVIKIEPIGKATVYCLTTESENYVADGYASHNCSFTHRARRVGAQTLNGQDQYCLDVQCSHLSHQEVESSLTPLEKNRYNAKADEAIHIDLGLQNSSDSYRPFSLGRWCQTVGSDGMGILLSQLKQLSRVRSSRLEGASPITFSSEE